MFLTSIALFAVITAVMIDLPDTIFIGILLIAFVLLTLTVHLIEKEDAISEKENKEK